MSRTTRKSPTKKSNTESLIQHEAGQVRAVIERVSPELDGGRFPIKVLSGETVVVEADIFTDNHEPLTAVLLYKHAGDTEWIESPLTFIDNDRWTGSFLLESPGRYIYTIEAWVADKRQYAARYKELVVEVDPQKAGFSAWYGLFPRSISEEPGQHGTFREVERALPRIAALGFDVLYLPPIHPIGVTGRRGKNNQSGAQAGDPGNPYSVGNELGGHTAIHPELGTLDDFIHLIQIARNYEIDVALDFAVQCSPDHPWVKEHPNWFKKPDAGQNGVAEPEIYAFDFETEDWAALWLSLKQVLLTWASWGVRIVRASSADQKPFAFWEWIIREVKKEYPDLVFQAEAFTMPKIMRQLAKRGFSQSCTYYIWRNTKHELQEYVNELRWSEMQTYYRPVFWPATLDINPFNLQAGHEPQALIRYFMAATLSANYGIFGPSFELMAYEAIPGKEEYLNSEKYEIRHWNRNRNNRLSYLIGIVNRLRKENAALQTTNNLTFCRIDDDALMAYLKVTEANRLLIVVNLDTYNNRGGMVQVPIGQLGISEEQEYTVHDLLTDAYYTWKGAWNYVELDPYVLPMHLLRIEL
ncbi:maltotransferase domain-containing protein [Tellurirhabdus bombi]|uniref:maltotransferase domain-containing protein n=1 Tax=Tellurirhabdus bombi TaxID=2907205 RepID=UPI001F1D2144|nr:maltotransferase domain-containing protein [Tellurirhabdus bombi]